MIDDYSERNALQKILNSSLDVNNSLIDKLEVEQGYENALDALLGDELYYSTDDTNLIHWR